MSKVTRTTLLGLAVAAIAAPLAQADAFGRSDATRPNDFYRAHDVGRPSDVYRAHDAAGTRLVHRRGDFLRRGDVMRLKDVTRLSSSAYWHIGV